MKPLHKGVILGLRVTDIHVVLRTEEHAQNLGFAAHGLAAAGRPQLQTVGAACPFSVQHNHVAGLGVDAVIHGVAALKKLLRHEWDEHGHAGSRQRTLDFDVAGPQRQAAHKALFLLVVQPDKGIVVFLRHARGPEDFVLQLLPGVGGIQNQKGDLEHPFIAALQGFQKLLGVLPVGGKVAGKYVHVIAAADGPFLLLYLHGVKVGDFPLDGFNGLPLVDGLHMEIDDNAVFRVQEVGQHFVRQLRGEDLQKAHGPVLAAQPEHPGIAEAERGRGNEILSGKPRRGQPLPVKMKRFPVRVENAVHDFQPFFCVQHPCNGAHALEIA